MRKTYRRFLNKLAHNGAAHVRFTLTVRQEWNDDTDKRDGAKYVSGTFTIHDCSDEVTLDFHSRTKKQIANSKHKIKMLKQAIERFEQDYETILKEL